MTDNEIAARLRYASRYTFMAKRSISFGYDQSAYGWAFAAAHQIHHIINSINWED